MKKQLYLKVYNKDFEVTMDMCECTGHDKGIVFPGVHYFIDLGNSYFASVIKKYGSYGYIDDLWEIALTHRRYAGSEFIGFDMVNIGDKFDLLDDVIGYLTEEEVNEWIDKFYNEYVKKDESA